MSEDTTSGSGEGEATRRKPRPYPTRDDEIPFTPPETVNRLEYPWRGIDNPAYKPPGAPATIGEMTQSDDYLTPGKDFHVDALVKPVPPGWRTRFKHSLGFYCVVLGGMSGLANWAYFSLRSDDSPDNPVMFWTAVVTTAFSLLVLFLRVVRGSMLDAEDKARTNLVIRPDPSDRIAKRLHGGEYVLFETKLHPISIVPTMLGRLWRGKWRRRLSLGYIVLLGIAWAGHEQSHGPFSTNWVIAIAAIAPLFIIFSLYEWSRERYALTNERLIGISGIFSSHVGEMPRARMTDVGIDTEWYANILAWCRFINLPFATWDVETAGQDQRLKSIPGVPMGDIVVSVFSLSQRSNEG